MIYVTGDTHGDIDYKKLLTLKKKNVSYKDYLTSALTSLASPGQEVTPITIITL